ncbi:unnamed protein product [Linum tenue]|uniref:Bifunctional inhibitor/plant lipid transfer protein/seed storage helical domain-containing protein n=1 Tax=Linum tenue TaxID=586396 RepID=A0AAV0QP03_9ROSI|nr:unnamed protein product [Linum tenue]
MGFLNLAATAFGVVTLLLFGAAAAAGGALDCTTVTGLISACSAFITYGSPDPLPGSPCCEAMTTLGTVAETGGSSGGGVCRCLLGLIATYNPNATAIATLPGFCGIDMGFIIDPNTDCA